MTARAAVPPHAESIIASLHREGRRYVASGAAEGFVIEWRDGSLYVDAVQRFRGKRRSKLARLDPGRTRSKWILSLWLYSRDDYDDEGDFPFGFGTPEACFSAAADFYLWEYDALSAGSSVGQEPPPEKDAFSGPARLRRGGEPPPVPALAPALREAAAKSHAPHLLVRLVERAAGRGLVLTERETLRREDLFALNAASPFPVREGARVFEQDVPAVRWTTTLARALDAVQVRRPRMTATAAGAALASADPVARWWQVLDAAWNRVRWTDLDDRADDGADDTQAGRRAFATLLARGGAWARSRVCHGDTLTDNHVLPFLRDAGLLDLQVADTRGVPMRRMGLASRVAATPLGRAAFAALADASPEVDGLELLLEDPGDDLDDLLSRARMAGSNFDLYELLGRARPAARRAQKRRR